MQGANNLAIVTGQGGLVDFSLFNGWLRVFLPVCWLLFLQRGSDIGAFAGEIFSRFPSFLCQKKKRTIRSARFCGTVRLPIQRTTFLVGLLRLGFDIFLLKSRSGLSTLVLGLINV